MTPASRALAPALTFALCLAPASARGDDVERQGGRVGLSLLGGAGIVSNDASSASMGLAGVAIRFGGAVTDRFHLMGELTLAAMPGGSTPRLGDVTGLHPALALLGEGYIGPRFFIRGGVGAGWLATKGGSWALPLPGPRFSGGVGYNFWRKDERQISVALDAAYTVLFYGDNPPFDRLLTVTVQLGFDWY